MTKNLTRKEGKTDMATKYKGKTQQEHLMLALNHIDHVATALIRARLAGAPIEGFSELRDKVTAIRKQLRQMWLNNDIAERLKGVQL